MLYCVGVVAFTISITGVYYVWSYALCYPYPMPFQGLLLAFETLIIMYIQLWFQFPQKLRKDEKFRKRMKYMYHALFISSTIPTQYHLIGIVFIAVPPEYQWALALCLPIVREVNLSIMLRMSRTASECKSWPVVCSVSHYTNARHSMFMAVIIGSVVTYETSLLILGIDFVINIYLCLKLIYLRTNKNSVDLSKQVSLIQELVLNEHVEFVMSIAYFVCFLSAYYGPNSENIGSVKYVGWGFKPLTDISNFYKNITTLFLIDTSSVVICTVTLWMVCKINLLRAYYQTLKEFWFHMAVQTAFLLEFVSINV